MARNNKGYSPGAVADAIARQPQEDRASVYFVAFDVSAERFNSVKEAGGLVLEAADERELNQTMDFILTGRILVEQPTTRPPGSLEEPLGGRSVGPRRASPKRAHFCASYGLPFLYRSV